jgi:hypothetical protein
MWRLSSEEKHFVGACFRLVSSKHVGKTWDTYFIVNLQHKSEESNLNWEFPTNQTRSANFCINASGMPSEMGRGVVFNFFMYSKTRGGDPASVTQPQYHFTEHTGRILQNVRPQWPLEQGDQVQSGFMIFGKPFASVRMYATSMRNHLSHVWEVDMTTWTYFWTQITYWTVSDGFAMNFCLASNCRLILN